MKHIFTLVFVAIFVSSLTVLGQSTANYAFSSATDASLIDMSSGTTDIFATGTYRDDVASSVFNIGFTFYFMGVPYSQFSINSNGLMRLGSSAIGGAATSPSSGSAILGPISGDNSLQASGKAHFKIIGTSPNQTLVVEWVDLRIPFGSETGNTYCTFQVLLYEGSGIIEFIYGRMHNMGTSAQSRGIFFSSGTSAGQIGQITTITTTPTYNSTATSLTTTSFTASSAMTNLNSSTDGSRTKFTFTPPIAPDAPTDLSFASVTGTSMTLNWTDNASNETGYAILRSTDGINYSLVTTLAANIQTYSATALNFGTTYHWKVVAVNEGAGSDVSGTQATNPGTISGDITIGGSGTPDYATLTAAFAAITTNGLAGNVNLILQEGYTSAAETFPLTGPSTSAMDNYTATIYPVVTGLSITSAHATATINLDGIRNLIYDGRVNATGTTKDLIIANTNSGTSPAIRFINDANNNTFKYCKINSRNNSTTSGTIFFGTTTGANGNDNNTIEYCDIYDGTSTPFNAIYATGTTTTTNHFNSNNTISNCNIYNYFNATGLDCGIYITSGNTDWTISGNSFYQTASRTHTTAATRYGIFISNSSGNNFVVTNNFIGGTQAECGGTPMTNGGTVLNLFRGIYIWAGTTTPSSVQGNVIRNIAFTTSSTSSTNPGIWTGIQIAGGNVNVGTITPNIIGNSTGTGSIALTSTANGSISSGISVSGGTTVNIQNNTIASMTAIGSTSISHGLYGIWTTSGTTLSIQNNTIGSTATANSFQANSASTSATAQHVVGIFNSSSGTISILNNTIANLFNAYTGTTSSQIRGIVSGFGTNTITGNTVRNLSIATQSSGTGVSASVIGIAFTSTTTGTTISQNTIYGLSNSTVTPSNISVIGLHYGGSTTGTNIVSRNMIHGLNTTATGTTSIIGFNIASGTTTFQNNKIRLGIDASGNSITVGHAFTGIADGGGTNNYYFNSVYMGGTGVSGSSATHCFNSTVTTNTRNFVNNIFMNARSNGGGTGKHYAVRVAGTTPNPAGLTMNYNCYFTSGTGGVFGFFNSTDVASLADWKTAVGQDANSIFGDPLFAGANGANPDLHLTEGSPCEGAGLLIGSVTDDFDGEVRADLTPTDIGADAGDYAPAGVDMGAFALVAPAASGCYSSTQAVTVTIRNFAGEEINFTTNPVTVIAKVPADGSVYSGSKLVNTGTLAMGGTINVTLDETIDMTANGSYEFHVSTSVTGDINTANDALAPITRTVNAIGGTYAVGSGGDFVTLTAAVAAYNNATCLSDAVVFTLTDATYSAGETFPIVINEQSTASPTKTLTIKPDNGIATAITGTSSSAIIRLNGADYIIIDGLNTGGSSLTIENTSTATSTAAIWLSSLGVNAGATNNTIQNCIIKAGSITTTSTFAIFVGGSSISTFGTGEHNNNLQIINNTIEKCYYGIYARGVATTGLLTGLKISNNVIGSNTAADYVIFRGIDIQNAIGPEISGNTIFNMKHATAVNNAAIDLGANVSNATVFQNRIYGIHSTNTGGYGAYGINISATTTSNIAIYNNLIYDLITRNYSPTSTAWNAFGIRITGGTEHKVYFNNIHFYGNVTEGTSAGMSAPFIATVGTNLDVRNNIFANKTAFSITGSKSYAAYISSGVTFSELNYNNYFSSGTYALLGFYTADRTTLEAWQTASSKDEQSKNIDPNFASDVNLQPASQGLDAAGQHLGAPYNVDFNNIARSNPPDIGAIEFTPPSCMPPSSLTATDINGYTANLSWTNGDTEELWDIYIGATPLSAPDGSTPPTVANVNTKPYLITGLNPTTQYAFYVRANCGLGNLSDWSGPHTFTTTISCPAPAALNTTATTATSASLAWTSSAGSFQIEYGISPYTFTGTANINNIPANSTLISGLTENTTYQYKVKAICGVGDESEWSATGTFSTPCEFKSIPFFEGFESGFTHNAIISNCWTQQAVTGTGSWMANSSNTDYNRTPRTGSFNATLVYSNNRWMFIGVSLTEGISYNFQMYARQDGATSTNASITVAYGTAPNIANMTTTIIPLTGLVNGDYQKLFASFTPSSTGNYYIGINGNINSTPWYISIDDIHLYETPDCQAPINITATAIGSDQATFSWTELNSADTWNVEVGNVGFAPGTGAEVSGLTATNDNPAIISGLTQLTSYHVYVQADCGSSVVSGWGGPFAFTTGKPEPENQVTNLATGTVTTTSIPLTWTAAVAGTQAPDGYLIKASSIDFDAVTNPVDHVDPANLLTFTEGLANRKVTPGTATSGLSFSGMTAGTMYYYKVYSYTGTGAAINFKTDNVPTLKHATRPTAPTAPVFTANSSTEIQISWTAPTGYDNDKHTTLVFIKPTSAITQGTPTSVAGDYTASATFGLGSAFQNDPSAFCVYNGDGTNVTVSGLSHSTTYFILVYSVVEEVNSNATASYSSALTTSGSTICEPKPIPFFEGFETNHSNGLAIGNCWTQEAVSGTSSWMANSTNTTYNRTPRTGSFNATLMYSNNRWMFQEVTLTEDIEYTFEIYARQDGAVATNASITVAYGTSASAASMTNIIVPTTEIINGNYQKLEGTFIPTSTGTYYIGINGNINSTPWYISIDDIYLYETPNCPFPSALQTSNITANSADITWTNGDAETKWDIYYGTTPLTAPDESTLPTISDVETKPYTISSLTANTQYAYYVRANCEGTAGKSSWTGPQTFTTLPSCIAPTALSTVSTTDVQATVTWTHSAEEFVIEYGISPYTFTGTANVTGINTNSATITGLTEVTTYQYRVKAICDTEDESAWSATGTFTTICGVRTAPIDVETFTSFTGLTNTPLCWTQATGVLAASSTLSGTSSKWTVASGFANAGTNKAVKTNLYSTANDWIISPQIDLGATPGQFRLSYRYAVTSWNGTAAQSTLGTHRVSVVVSTDGGITWSNANVIKEYTGVGTYSNTGVTEIINLTAYSGIVKIAFVQTTSSTTPDIDFHIDDFVVEPIPDCNNPSALATSQIAGYSATISWTNGGTETQWDIYYGPTPLTAPNESTEPTIEATEDKPYNITGLTPTTQYAYYVRANCGGTNGVSIWTGPQTFTTTVSCPAPTALTNEVIVPNAASVSWTSNAGAFEIEYGVSPYTFTGTANIENINTNSTTISGLSPTTTYQYKVKAICGVDDESEWSITGTFTTPCEPEMAPTNIETFTTFTGLTNTPICWIQATGTLAASSTLSGTTSKWTSAAGFANSGTNKAVKTNLYSTANDWIISQPIDLGATPGLYRLSYRYAVTSYNGTVAQSTLGTHRVSVVVSTDGGITWSNTNVIKEYTGVASYSNTGETEIINLTAYSGIIKIAFVQTTSTTSPDIDFHIDDFVVEAIPACAAPIMLTATNIGATQANLGWSQGSSETEWNVEVGTVGFIPGSSAYLFNANATTSNPWTVSGLTQQTSYQFYVQSVCGATTSEWAGPFSFATGKPEPTNQATNFAAGTISTTSIPLSWTAAVAGSQAPDGYLVKASNTDFSAITDPIDGIDPSDVTAFTSGLANRKVTPGTAISALSFTNMVHGTMYYYKMYSYTNSGNSINFKTDNAPTLKHATRPNAATTVAFASTSTSTANITWNLPTGYDPARHTIVVFLKPASSVTQGTPTTIAGNYTANTAFGSGTPFQNDATAYCIYNGDGTSVSVTDLSHSTTYHVLVYCIVEEANSNATSSYSTGATSSGAMPCGTITPVWTETFNTFPPTCWTRTKGILATPVTTSGTTSVWTADGFANVGTTGAARVNIYGTTVNDWLITPSIDLGDGTTQYQLSFDLALTAFNNTNPPQTNGTDDKFAIVISTDDGATWSAANTLRLWDNAGSAFVYNNISNTGQNVIIDLSAYTGVVKIGFYGESTVSNADNDLSIDNVIVELFTPCLKPTTLIASSITSSSVSINWTEGGTETTWDIYYGTTPLTAPDGVTSPTVSGISVKPHVLSALTPNTQYAFYVRADCNLDGKSEWTGPLTFSTLCESVASFTEDFDGVTVPAIPACWNNIGTGTVNTQITNNFSAPNCLYMLSSSVSNVAVVTMPPVSSAGAGTHFLSFRARSATTTGAKIQIGYMTNPSDPATFVYLDEKTLTLAYAEYTVYPGTSPGANTVLAFRANSSPALALLIDDVKWQAIPTCFAPTALTATNIQATQATLGWSSGANHNNWDVEVGLSGFTPGTGNAVVSINATINNPWTATALTPSTSYQFYVKADCGSGDLSGWGGPFAFTTLKGEPTNQPTNFAASGVTTTAIAFTWTPAVAGTHEPDGYLLKASSTSFAAITDPVDGTDPTNLTVFTGGLAHKKVTPASLSSTTSFTGMTAGTMYYYKIYSYSNSGTNIDFKTNAVPQLKHATNPNPVTLASFTPASTATATISWTAPVGYNAATHTTLVFIKANTSITAGTPSMAATTYTANTVFGAGTAYQNDANARCVFNGDGTSVSISGLSINTTYHVLIVCAVEETNSNTTSSYSSTVTASGATLCNPLSVPYFEGFEAGHTNNASIANCWTQQAISGTNAWTANSIETSYNRTPRTGSFNAYLRYGNNRWMFQAVNVTAGKGYTFEMYARQDGSVAANASITVAYGTSASAASMTNIIVPTTGLINGNYQKLTGSFIATTTETIYIGINGNINSTPWYISIDDISLIETPAFVWTGALNANWSEIGNWSAGMLPNASSNVTIPQTSNNPVISSPISNPAVINNITIQNGAALFISPASALTVNQNMINNGAVVILSSATGDGSLIVQGNVSFSLSARFHIDRYITSSVWHCVSSPLTNASTSVFSGLWLRRYIESTNSWASITSPYISLNPGEGFIAWASDNPTTKRFSGRINHGVVGPINLPRTSQGFNLIGNPYQSAIDWNASSGWTKTNMSNTTYIWNGGNWASYNGTIGQNGGSRHIALGQGFLVQSQLGGGSITMDKGIRVHNSIAFKNEEYIPNVVRIHLNGNNHTDETVLMFTENTSDDFNYQHDAMKLYGLHGAPQLYTKKQNDKLAIHSVNYTDDLDEKFVYVEVDIAGTYTVSFEHTIENGLYLLKDIFSNALIQPNQLYTFIAQPNDDAARFMFVKNTTDMQDTEEKQIDIWEHNNILFVQTSANQTIRSINIYNAIGSHVMQTSSLQTDLSRLPKGVYIVKVTTDSHEITRKVSVK